MRYKELRAELRVTKEEAARERIVSESKLAELERADIRARRAAAQAESERDAMTVTLKQRGEAADAAIAEAQAAGERRAVEAEAVQRAAAEAVRTEEKKAAALQAQLDDAARATAGLQELLAAQSRVADGYRREAERLLAQIGQMEQQGGGVLQESRSNVQTPVRTRELEQQLRAQQSQLEGLSKNVLDTRTGSLEDLHKGLDEMRAELQAGREREEQHRMALESARLLVQ